MIVGRGLRVMGMAVPEERQAGGAVPSFAVPGEVGCHPKAHRVRREHRPERGSARNPRQAGPHGGILGGADG